MKKISYTEWKKRFDTLNNNRTSDEEFFHGLGELEKQMSGQAKLIRDFLIPMFYTIVVLIAVLIFVIVCVAIIKWSFLTVFNKYIMDTNLILNITIAVVLSGLILMLLKLLKSVVLWIIQYVINEDKEIRASEELKNKEKNKTISFPSHQEILAKIAEKDKVI